MRLRMYRKAGTVGILVLILCSSWVVAQPLRGNPRSGEAIYNMNCVSCHGPGLDGRGPEAQYLIVAPTNFHSMDSRLKTDWELLLTISHGALFTPMHGWRDRLSDQEMLDVLSYIRVMAPRGTIS